jgi:hypothetical protein
MYHIKSNSDDCKWNVVGVPVISAGDYGGSPTHTEIEAHYEVFRRATNLIRLWCLEVGPLEDS